jgi:sigma-E factor negative regulatory protein RseB
LRVVRPEHSPTRLEAQGWSLVRPVAGFRLSGCIKRPVHVHGGVGGASGPVAEVMQAVFSDGLTHVSLFVEPFDGARHGKRIQAQFGATHSLAQRRGEHWVTAMGDVPPATLRLFVDSLDRRP